MVIDPVILGYFAAFSTTCSFIPQVVHTIKTKDTEAISLGMYSFFVFGVLLWLIYGVLVNDFPIIIANTITLALASIILSMKVKNTFQGRKKHAH